MEKKVEEYSIFFNESITSTSPHGLSFEIPANQLSYDKDFNNDYIKCVGVFYFLKNKPNHASVNLSVRKGLRLTDNKRGRKASQVEKYSYHISIRKSMDINTSVIRFDNGDDFGFTTNNHLHIQIESENKIKEIKPFPAHTNSNFPHIGDIFKICFALTTSDDNPIKIHKRWMDSFQSISNSNKMNPIQWVSQFNNELFNFIR